MKYNPEIHHRRSIRLKGYDYSQEGAYFVTICTQNRECLLGEIFDGNMVLNEAGQMIETVWAEMQNYYTGVDIDIFQIMPNHFHGIIMIVGATPRGCPDIDTTRCTDMDGCIEPNGCKEMGQARGPAPTTTLSLPDAVHRFKTMTTKRYTDGVKQKNWPPFNK